jgi:hypothetical protein
MGDYAVTIDRDESGAAVRLGFTPCAPDTATPSEAAGSVATLKCLRCGEPFAPKPRRHGSERRYCSIVCRRLHWDETHPRVKEPVQAALDFTPPAQPQPILTEPQREWGSVEEKRAAKRRLILARLESGPASTLELLRIDHRFSARLGELKLLHPWTKAKDERTGGFVYTLEHP